MANAASKMVVPTVSQRVVMRVAAFRHSIQNMKLAVVQRSNPYHRGKVKLDCLEDVKAAAPPSFRLLRRTYFVAFLKANRAVIAKTADEREDIRKILKKTKVSFSELILDGLIPLLCYIAFFWVAIYPALVAIGIILGLFASSDPLKREEIKKEFFPLSDEEIAELKEVVFTKNCFALIEGPKGTGKSTLLMHLCATLPNAISVSLEDAQMSGNFALHPIAAKFGLAQWQIHLILNFLAMVGRTPVVCYDIEPYELESYRFRNDVRQLVTRGLLHAILVTSEGEHFTTLTEEARLVAFKAKELSLQKALDFVKPNTKITEQMLKKYPRTAHSLEILGRVPNPQQHVDRELEDAVKRVNDSFGQCHDKKKLLQTAIGGELCWHHVQRWCCNEYDTQKKFRTEVIHERNLFYPTGTDSFVAQFDQTNEAMRIVKEQ